MNCYHLTSVNITKGASMRPFTKMLLELIDQDILDRDAVIDALLDNMSEDDVKFVMYSNEWLSLAQYDEEEEE
jgi:hypothetical protein